MYRNFLFACVALLLAGTAFGQTPDDLRGTWALQVDGRNLVVLHLEGAARQLTGSLQRPMGLSLGPATQVGTGVSQIRMPLFTAQLKEARVTPAGRVFALRYQGNDAGEILIRSEAGRGVRFAMTAAAPENSLLPLVGVSDTAAVATATLDRYLQRIDRSRIFGTEYVGLANTPFTRGKYDTALIPDSLRSLLGVPTREQQEAWLKQMNAGK